MKVIITGGAGFIGINAAMRFAEAGHEVVIFDNFSRVGAEENVQWLAGKWPKVDVCRGDVRSDADCDRFFRIHADASLVLHLAGQVAVTRSVVDPREDFESNALGTLNVLEAVRRACPDCVLIYSSTNKVYGGPEGVPVVSEERRYSLDGYDSGIPETFPLDFHSPYGCSKGCADQYVRDYARIYGLKTVVFRQSRIYGYRQFGVEDQGWVAWFTIASVAELRRRRLGESLRPLGGWQDQPTHSLNRGFWV